MSVAYSQRTWQAKPGDVAQQWHLVDADGQILGRMANTIAVLLMGKHKPAYTPHIDTGDFVVVTNATKVVVTGRKAKEKVYQHFTGYPGGRRLETFDSLMERNPEKLIRLAVRRMLPKNSLGRKMLKKLKIYEGTEHPHQAQQPAPCKITNSRRDWQEALSK